MKALLTFFVAVACIGLTDVLVDCRARRCIRCGGPFAVFAYRRCLRHRVRA